MKVESRELRVESKTSRLALRAASGPRPSTLDPRPPRRGMTLIELLVVIVILTTLVAAAIPLLSPSNDDRRLRETVRGLNTYITGAQARAASTHRPFGIAIKRLSKETRRVYDPKKPETLTINDDGVSLEVFYVEELPPYTGFDANSRACVAIHPNPPAFYPNAVLIRFVTRGNPTADLPMGWTSDLFPSNTIQPGDVIEINGTQFVLLDYSDSYSNIGLPDRKKKEVFYSPRSGVATLVALPLNNSGQQINPRYDNKGIEIGAVRAANPPFWTSPAPYKIQRLPTSTSDEPYQLPEGTAIDLRASGVGSQNYFYVPGLNDNDEGILILFTPEGRVGRVAYYQTPGNVYPFDQAVTDNVYLLVGRRDRIPAPLVAADPTLNSSSVAAATTDEARAKLREPINWLNGSSRWVVIGAQTGRVVTIENASVDLAGVLSQPLSPFQSASPSTEEMRCAQILAAREFTREMGQLGGR